MTPRVKVIKADYLLKDKIGTGTVNQDVVELCQAILDNNPFDFSPIAHEQLETLIKVIGQAQRHELTRDDATQKMTECVMQLKANAPMFGYDLVGQLANIMLSFLESISEIDDHAIEIVSAHHNTLHAIVVKKMRGDGGQAGKQFEIELKNACERYFNSKRKKEESPK